MPPSARSAVSSITYHPERERSPSSISARLFSPSAPSSVRIVPFRFNGSFFQGYQTTVCPSTSNVIFKFLELAGLNVPGKLFKRYCNNSFSVLMYRNSSSSHVSYSGTGKRRFITVNEARSSKICLSLHSIRIISGVRIVKRISPDRTIAFGSATGLFSAANICRNERIKNTQISKRFFMFLVFC